MVRKVLVILFLLCLASSTHAQERVAGNSASLSAITHGPVAQKISYRDFIMEKNIKKRAIKSLLESRNSPMTGSVDSFMHSCQTYDIDCYFLPAITGLESGFGHYILQGSYNPFGWNGGYYHFTSWGHGIETVAEGIQERYVRSGAVTIEQIGAKYAESPTWASRVRGFMTEFEREEEKTKLNFSYSELQL